MKIFSSYVIVSLLVITSCNQSTESVENEREVVSAFKYTKFNPDNGEFPGGRDMDDLIIYTSDYGESTGTNPWGIEAIIKENYVVSSGSNNSPIPNKGFVISGHGVASRWISTKVVPGLKVEYDKDSIYLIKTIKSDLYYAKMLNDRAIERGGQKSDLTSNLESAIKAEKVDASEVSSLLEDIKHNLYKTYPYKESEVKAVWYRPVDKSPEDVERTVKEMAELGINMLCPETIFGGYSIYPSSNPILKQNPEFVGWDPLSEYVKYGKKYGVSVVPWVWCYFVGFEDSPLVFSQNKWLGKSRKGDYKSELEVGYNFFCPSEPKVRLFWLDVYKDLLTNYKLEGLQLDYIRYAVSSPWELGFCYCERCQSKFKEASGIDVMAISPADTAKWEKWNSYRISNITGFVGEVRNLIDEVSPSTRLSADVFPDEDSSLKSKKQDWGDWLRKGLIDDVFIMSYTSDADIVADQTTYMRDRVGEGQRGMTGLGPYIGISAEILLEEIITARNNGSDGITLFSYNSLTDEQKTALKLGPFNK